MSQIFGSGARARSSRSGSPSTVAARYSSQRRTVSPRNFAPAMTRGVVALTCSAPKFLAPRKPTRTTTWYKRIVYASHSMPIQLDNSVKYLREGRPAARGHPRRARYRHRCATCSPIFPSATKTACALRRSLKLRPAKCTPFMPKSSRPAAWCDSAAARAGIFHVAVRDASGRMR